jgi:hypothetical protein
MHDGDRTEHDGIYGMDGRARRQRRVANIVPAMSPIAFVPDTSNSIALAKPDEKTSTNSAVKTRRVAF